MGARGVRLNDDCPGNRIAGASNLCENVKGAISERIPGALIVESGVTCGAPAVATMRSF